MRVLALVSALFVGCPSVAVSGNERAPLRVAVEGPMSAFDADLLTTFAKTRGRAL